jgi:hypothetical protein
LLRWSGGEKLRTMAELFIHVVFVFAVLGTKLIIALWVIYYLFPDTRTCPECAEQTIPLQMDWLERFCGSLLFLGKVRRRWCPECAWEGFARRCRTPMQVGARAVVVDSADRRT